MAIAPAQAGESDTSLYVVETLGEVLAELECEDLITPAKREVEAEGRVAAPATHMARHPTADQVSCIHSLNYIKLNLFLCTATRTIEQKHIHFSSCKLF